MSQLELVVLDDDGLVRVLGDKFAGSGTKFDVFLQVIYFTKSV